MTLEPPPLINKRWTLRFSQYSDEVTGWNAEVRVPSGATASRPALGPIHPRTHSLLGALSLGVKRLGREADHSPPSVAEVNNAWRYTSTPQDVFTA
jgi:hypothetical protein